jgi:hypothetical protein
MKTILQSTLLIALSALLGCQSLRAQTVNKLDVFGYNQQEGRVSTQIDSDGNRYVLATLQHTVGSFSGFQTIIIRQNTNLTLDTLFNYYSGGNYQQFYSMRITSNRLYFIGSITQAFNWDTVTVSAGGSFQEAQLFIADIDGNPIKCINLHDYNETAVPIDLEVNGSDIYICGIRYSFPAKGFVTKVNENTTTSLNIWNYEFEVNYGNIGNSANMWVNNLAIDNSGIYVAGSYAGHPLFIADSLHAADNNGFVAKLNFSGQLQWAKGCFAANNRSDMLGTAVVSDGNIYYAGRLKGDFTYGSTTISASSNQYNGLIMKLSPAGALLESVVYQGRRWISSSH